MAYIRAKDRIGTTVNGFYINDAKRENNRNYLLITCPVCGNKKWMYTGVVTDKRNKSCGCASGYEKKDITNMMFGRLKAIEPTEQRRHGQVVWKCECQCENKNIIYAPEGFLQAGHQQSCGCLREENWKKSGIELGKKAKEYCVNGTSAAAMVANTPTTNTSGYKGVCWHKKAGKWRAQIKFKGKQYHLGLYEDIELAAEARKEAEKRLFGNFLEWYAQEYPEQWERLNKRRNKKKD